jgi:hypothetical protein
VQEKLDRERSASRRDNHNALARANAQAGNEQVALQGYLARGRLPQVLNAFANARHIGGGTNVDDVGLMYRMGNYSPAEHGNVLPSVQHFILAFRRTSYFVPAPSPLGNEATQDGAQLMQQFKGKLRDLLQCDPAAGDSCEPPRKNVPTGVRG